jgi:hypothetical protein
MFSDRQLKLLFLKWIKVAEEFTKDGTQPDKLFWERSKYVILSSCANSDGIDPSK